MKSGLGTATKLCFIAAISLITAGCLSGGGSDSPDTASPNPPTPTPPPPPPPPPPPGNSAPTIAGTPPPAVVVGNNYAFTPTASDPDGDTLTFSIQNQPSWADFESSTGRLSGVAPAGSEGTYANIRISVSDGALSSSLSPFSIDVNQVALGSATLSWTAPTQNTDGSALNNLAAYKVYYGTSSGSYNTEIRIDNPGLTSYVVDNLTPATYFFVTTAINDQGVESAFSNEASKTIN